MSSAPTTLTLTVTSLDGEWWLTHFGGYSWKLRPDKDLLVSNGLVQGRLDIPSNQGQRPAGPLTPLGSCPDSCSASEYSQAKDKMISTFETEIDTVWKALDAASTNSPLTAGTVVEVDFYERDGQCLPLATKVRQLSDYEWSKIDEKASTTDDPDGSSCA